MFNKRTQEYICSCLQGYIKIYVYANCCTVSIQIQKWKRTKYITNHWSLNNEIQMLPR